MKRRGELGEEHRKLHTGGTEDTKALGGKHCIVKFKVIHTHT